MSSLHLHQSRLYYTPSKATSSERDVLMQIELYLSQLSTCFSFAFVKGHQDDNKALHELNSAALANTHADALASSALDVVNHSIPTCCLMSSHSC